VEHRRGSHCSIRHREHSNVRSTLIDRRHIHFSIAGIRISYD
jgi:hypothetical protein